MSPLARTNGGRQVDERNAPWPSLQGLFGFDPYQRLAVPNWQVDFDVMRTERGYEVEVPVPGFKPEQIEITFKDGVLAMNGKNERRTFSRSFTIPEDVDPDNIEAKVADGMLHLILDRRPEAQPKRITIK
jgi:HSP20 family molecular chaperone IbpA